MLKTNRKFRFYEPDSAKCEMALGTGVTFPVPPEFVFDASKENLSDTILIKSLHDVHAFYQEALQRQWLLWALVAFGAIFTAAVYQTFGWVGIIPYALLCCCCGNSILCLPDGSIYDTEHNVLYKDGHLNLHDMPDTTVYVKGSEKYR